MTYKSHEKELLKRKELYYRNREKLLIKKKDTYHRNKNIFLERKRIWYSKNKLNARKHQKNYREKNRDWNLKRMRDDYAKNRISRCLKVKEHYNNIRFQAMCLYGGMPPRCHHCGQSDYDKLNLDHINEDGWKDRKMSPIVFWRRIIKENDFARYQVLCYSCNRKKYIGSSLFEIRNRMEMIKCGEER